MIFWYKTLWFYVFSTKKGDIMALPMLAAAAISMVVGKVAESAIDSILN
ncbi:hypothetical protein [Helicobacter bilis]|nr:hypothetical protein [Helicobacter bilis]